MPPGRSCSASAPGSATSWRSSGCCRTTTSSTPSRAWAGGAGVAGHRRQGMTAAAIAARGLGKDFGSIRALDALDLEVREGEFFGFLGPNGAGKTTTVHIFATLLAPSRGAASVAGYDIVREDLQVRRAIGLVFQETTLDRDLTVAENLRFAARLWSIPGRA